MDKRKVIIDKSVRYDVQSYMYTIDGEGWFTEYFFEKLEDAKTVAEQINQRNEVRVVKTTTTTYMEITHEEVCGPPTNRPKRTDENP